MAQSKSAKRLFNMAYGLGAAVVILGALFKILHWPFGNKMLMVGMIVEAIVFAISAFESVEDDLDWTKVYPELGGGIGNSLSGEASPAEAQSLLSQKLDNLLADAKLDASLMSRLGDGIKNFENAAQGLTSASETVSSTNKYNEQMSLAAVKMEQLNTLYVSQVESAEKQTELNAEMVKNASRLQEQMESLATNLSSLNGVYGGMLSAMSSK